MIIDMRLRPPLPSLVASVLYQEVGKTEHPDFPRLPSVAARSVDLLLAEMDAAEVAVGVVPGRYSLEPFGQVPNEEMEALFARHPGRFVGFMGIDLRWPMERILDEIDRRSRAPGFVGVSIEPAIALEPSFSTMDDPLLYPIYEACVQRDLPVSVTLSAVLQGFTRRPYEYSNPIQAYKVATDFPKLDIHIAHAGYPWIMEMIGVCLACPNVWLSPDLYMVDLFPGAQEYAKAARNYFADRTLWGSNYPTKPFKPMLDAYRKWDWPDTTTRKVLGLNAKRLLRLD